MANWLLSSAVVVNSLLLCAGLTASLYDIDEHGWGLYLILVSLVSFMMISAFCLVGTEAQKETIAHQFWESTRYTVRKYTPLLTKQGEPGGALLTIASAASLHFQPENATAHHIPLNFLTVTVAKEPTVTFASSPSLDEEEEDEVQL